MLVSELITIAQLQSEEVYDEPTWIDYINLALDDLTPSAYYVRSKEGITVALTGGSADIDLYSDDELKRQHRIIGVYFTQINPTPGNMRQLRTLSFTNNSTEGWKMFNNKIRLQHIKDTATGTASIGGTCRVDFFSKYGHVSSLADDIEVVSGLPEPYHRMLVDYMCAKSQQKEEELNDKNDFYNDYLYNKRIFTLEQKIVAEPHKRKQYERMLMQLKAGGAE